MGFQTLYGKGPHPLHMGSLRTARGKNKFAQPGLIKTVTTHLHAAQQKKHYYYKNSKRLPTYGLSI